MMYSIRHILCLCSFALLLFAACKPGVPSDVIAPSKMEQLLYDYALADGMASQQPGDASENSILLQQAVLRKYGLTQADFDSSMVYYTRHADRLRDIYQHVSDRLQRDAQAQGASVKETAGSAMAGDSIDIWRGERSMMLRPQMPYNYYSYDLKPGKALRRGDGVSLRFDTHFIYQDGIRDGVVMLAVTFANDSTAAKTTHVSSTMSYTLTIDDRDSLGIKSVRGFFVLNKSTQEPSSTTLRLLSISGIRMTPHRLPKSTPAAQSATFGSSSRPNMDSIRRREQLSRPTVDSSHAAASPVPAAQLSGGRPIPPPPSSAVLKTRAR